MSFVTMDHILYCMIILSTCFLLQSTTVTLNNRCNEQEAEVGIIKAEPTSHSSIDVTWEFYETPTPIISNTSASGLSVSNLTCPRNFTENLTDLVMTYRPCIHSGTSWPTIVKSPYPDIYLVRYNIDEMSFTPKSKRLSEGEFHSTNCFRGETSDPLPLASGMVASVTNLPFPDWPYEFYLERIMRESSYKPSAHVFSRTYPALPNLCAGCFSIIRTRRHDRHLRWVRVHWRSIDPNPLGNLSYSVVAFEEQYKRKTPVPWAEGSLQQGSMEIELSLESNVLEFSLTLNNDRVIQKSTIFIPEEGNVFNWIPGITVTKTNTTTATLSLQTVDTTVVSWDKPKNVDVDYYTLVWYDKRSLCRNPDVSPINSWVHIPGNQTSMEFKITKSNGVDSEERVGWWISANTNTSSSGLQGIDGEVSALLCNQW